MKPPKIGSKIRIIDVDVRVDDIDDMYHDVRVGAIIVVGEEDFREDHFSYYFPDQPCFRGSCGIQWEQIKKSSVIITDKE